MATSSIGDIYLFSLCQIAAESYLEDEERLEDQDYLKRHLTRGTNREGYNFADGSGLGAPDLNQGWPGYTRMTDPQAKELLSAYTILHQWSDNPSTGAAPGSRPELDLVHTGGLILNGPDMLANTGFSATLIRKNGSNEYTLSIRSTESRPWEDGGDAERDMAATDTCGVVMTGFALAQLDALEKYYQWLKDNNILPQGAILNVTGYSLGGHLATVFTEIHQNDPYLGAFGNTVTFNGAGRGTWDGSVGNEAEFLAYYRNALNHPHEADIDLAACSDAQLKQAFFWMAAAGFLPSGSEWVDTATGVSLLESLHSKALLQGGEAFDAKSVYEDPRYGWAVITTMMKFHLAPQLPIEEHTTLADSLITQVYGYEAINNRNMTANSQNNAPESPVAIESQPLLDGLGGYFGNGDYGFGHSIDLITDSLALQRAMARLDTGFSLDTLLDVMPVLSAQKVRNVSDTTYEADPLENALDSLRRAILGPDVDPTPYRQGAGGFGDWDSRNTYHLNIQALCDSPIFAALEGKVTVALAYPGQSLSARDDFGAFLGLLSLSPLFLTAKPGCEAEVEAQLGQAWPDIYAQWAQDKAADTADFFSDQWLADRAAMMGYQLQINRDNAERQTTVDAVAHEGTYYADLERRKEIIALAPDDVNVGHLVLFDQDWTVTPLTGAEGNDRLYAGLGGSTLLGGAGDDRLEGQAAADVLRGDTGRDLLIGHDGDDTLVGGKGNDRLEGGKGNDTYLILAEDGIDTLRDSDGVGSVLMGGRQLTGGIQDGAGYWRTGDGAFRYALSGDGNGHLTLQVFPGAGSAQGGVSLLYIEDFHNGDLGIYLPGAPEPSGGNSGPILGDVAPTLATFVDTQGNPYETMLWDALGNIVGTPGAELRPDQLFGSTEADEMHGGEQNDSLFGQAGDDVLFGDNGNDLVAGGLGSDRIEGGSGDDILFGDRNAWQADPKAGNVALPATLPPPLEGAAFLDAGIDWARFTANADALPPVSHQNPDDVTALLASIAPARFGEVRLFVADISAPGQGQGGNDTVHAGEGNDVVYGEAGNDHLLGEAGADRLFGGAGADALEGGDEDDLLMGDGMTYAAFRWNVLDLTGSYHNTPDLAETYEAEFGNDLLRGGKGSDYLFGMAGADILYGDAGNDYLVGDFYEVVSIPVLRLSDDATTVFLDTTDTRAAAVQYHGNDFLDGGDGDDYLVGLAGDDDLYGGEGADVLVADGTPDEVQGRYGDDYLNGGGGNDFLQGSGGDDQVEGGDGNDELWGDEYAGTDGAPLTAWGGAPLAAGGTAQALAQEAHGRDHLLGGAGNDTLTGGGRDDRLEGGEGNDLLFGDGIGVQFEGDDQLFGGAGNDELQGNGGDDLLRGEDGDDRLFGQDGFDRLAGGIGADYLDGGLGDDHLDGGDDKDVLWGGAGDDTLLGGAADDQLMGNAGDDLLEGGRGVDYQSGGEGNDRYRLSAGDGVFAGAAYEMLEDSAGDDVVEFDGIASGSIELHEAAGSGDLALQYTAEDGVYLRGALGGAFERFRFSDGEWRWDDFVAEFLDDAVLQTDPLSNQMVVGGRRNDSLMAGSDAIVRGGRGDDAIALAAARNTLVFQVGDGHDVVTAGAEALTSADSTTVRFGAGIAPQDLSLVLRPAVGDAWPYRLEFRVGTQGSDSIATGVDNNNILWTCVLDRFEFADGTVLSLADLVAERGIQVTGGPGNDMLAGSNLGDRLQGGDGADTLSGGDGDDRLEGGNGSDWLRGGLGNDTYVFVPGQGDDQVAEGVGAASLADVLEMDAAITADNLLIGRDDHDLTLRVRGLAGSVVIHGQVDASAQEIEWFRFADGTQWSAAEVFARAQLGPLPVYWQGSALNETMAGDVGNDELSGLGGNDVLEGLAGNDLLDGGDGDDALYGGEGADSLVGGDGRDRLEGGAGGDTLAGGEEADSLAGNEGDDMLYGDAGNDSLVGGLGRDTLQGGTGHDTLYGDEDEDYLHGGEDYDTLLGGLGNDTLYGEAGDDWMRGDEGNDQLFGGDGDDYFLDGAEGNDLLHGDAGADTLSGGVGDDEVWGDDGDDFLIAGAGDDTLHGGAGGDILVDGVGTDVLYGDDGDDELHIELNDPDAGRDRLVGGKGDDTYVLQFLTGAGQVDIVELAGEGIDTVVTFADYVLADNLENLTLEGFDGYQDLSGTGNAANNVLRGNAGINTLKGAGGDDTYYVGKGDSVVEQSGDGTDTVFADADWVLGSNVENLVLLGAAVRGTGNGSANVMTGNGLNNLLDGGAGADRLAGGAGNDQYWVDSAADVVVEAAEEGIDLVFSSVTVATLAANVENLTLTGKNRINGNGNDLANVLTGNSAINVLAGGGGDDSYVVGAKDVVVEAAGGGRDKVLSAISWTLSDNVEDLELTGVQKIAGTGNALDNHLRGNSAANTLTGGSGNDTYLFGRGGGADVVVDNDATKGNSDQLLLDAGIAFDQLWFRKSGSDLEVSVIGTTDKVTISGWYSGNGTNHVERIEVADGHYLLDTQVEALVQAMAGMSPPAAGQLQLSASAHEQLDPVLAVSWQVA